MSLANKYRPNTFDDVIGQPVIIKILKKMIELQSYDHALFFVGPAGCGKTTTARIFANSIDGEIYEIDSASHNGVADVKEIVAFVNNPSLIHSKKVVIFDEAHTITSAAWSSLLIPLEENNDNVVYIFCTTESRKIPDTVLSRIQRFNFLPISVQNVYDRLKHICELEQFDADNDALDMIARNCSGNMREALTILDKCLLVGDVTKDNISAITGILNKDVIDIICEEVEEEPIKACEHIKKLQEEGYDLYQCVQFMINRLLDRQLYEEQKWLNQLNFWLNVIKELRYMIANPTNVCDFICASILCRGML